eukprot:6202969-Pleurochrysis_carterae.AAC.1
MHAAIKPIARSVPSKRDIGSGVDKARRLLCMRAVIFMLFFSFKHFSRLATSGPPSDDLLSFACHREFQAIRLEWSIANEVLLANGLVLQDVHFAVALRPQD